MSTPMKMAINGLGRIGRQVVRALQSGHYPQLQLVVVRDCMPIDLAAHLLAVDSTHGEADFLVSHSDMALQIGGSSVAYHQVIDKSEYPAWPNVDVVLECTGAHSRFSEYKDRSWQGARRVIISAPAESLVDQVIVPGANEGELRADARLLSAASCTTNALAVILAPLLDHLCIDNVSVTELHGYTRDQHLIDGVHTDWRRARGATQSMIPTRTLGIGTVERIFPALTDRVLGYSMRVPVVNSAALDLTIHCQGALPSLVDILRHFEQAAQQWQAQFGRPILGVSRSPLVSCDFIGRTESAVIDVERMVLRGQTLRLLAWFDNEVGYANRLLDLASLLAVPTP